ncbi:phytosulfokine receptor 1-like isoform X2 [Prosopis cineraria]|uniref:phytosulfokine receptor 1-like isoform X2 n=1 Tax=Prosopis cineraria TaxID=364024 RepID=UPI00240FD2B1|nr:phytosulfokine receptor 1-like isoform X2 [Prosopis cineraria]
MRLESFSARSNNFTGQMPTTLFLGTIPGSLSKCPRLEEISLSSNNLSGEVPVTLKKISSLTVLGLSSTGLRNLSSALNVLQHCRNLSILGLPNNFINEEMPQDRIVGFKSLQVLVLANSQIKGSVPKWLKGCKMLQFVDLSWNSLSGIIPSWFGKLDHLFYLDLSNNSLTGEIPESLTMILGIQNSNFSSRGTSYSSSSCTYLSTVKGDNTDQTRQPNRLEYDRVSRLCPSLVLSHNKLEEPIWPSFGNLKGLHVMDLKHNRLSGTIPDELSEMTMLEILDLSYNRLSREIPPSLVKLSFLSAFDVSYNQLQGKMPEGGQFETFPSSSFEGNMGLRLSGSVPSEAEDVPRQKFHHKDDKIVGLPFGFGALTGFVVAYTICFSLGWRSSWAFRRSVHKRRMN